MADWAGSVQEHHHCTFLDVGLVASFTHRCIITAWAYLVVFETLDFPPHNSLPFSLSLSIISHSLDPNIRKIMCMSTCEC